MPASRQELLNGKYIDDQMANGIPEGGATGQVLTKASDADYDTEWTNGGGGSQNLQQVTDIGNSTTNNIDVYLGGWVSVWSNIVGGILSARLLDDGTIFAALQVGIGNFTNNNVGYFTQENSNLLTGSRNYYLPDASGTIPLTVNGVGANSVGEIILTAFQDLQSVTDIGNTTTNDIIIDDGGGVSTLLRTNQIYIEDSATNDYINIQPNDPSVDIGNYSTGYRAIYDAGYIRFGSIGAAGTIGDSYLWGATTGTQIRNLYLPSSNELNDRTLALSVNGNFADDYGEITIPVGTISPLTTKGDLYTYSTTDARLPVGLDTQVLIADSTTATGLKWGSNTAPTPTGYYGAWQDGFTQTAAASNIGYAMIFRTTDLSNGVSVVTNGTNLTRITFANTGIYNIQFSAQFQNSDNQLHDVTIWLRKNGSDVSGSSGFISVPQRKNPSDYGHIIVSWNYLLSIVAGEYYEIVWSTDSHTYVTMEYYPAGSPPPATASVILTVTQQSGIMAGTGITAINSLTGATQTLGVGTSGTDFAIVSSGTSHTFNLPTASSTNRGALSSTDWTTFNSKQNALTNPVTGTGTNNELAYFNATGNTISSLTTATYPSLTELSYVKGVTSAIQTQIGNKFTTPTSWTDYLSSSTIVGATGTTGVINYIIMGKVMFLSVAISGTSNATNWTFTIPNTSAAYIQASTGNGVNNNSTQGIVLAFVTASSTTVNLSFSASGAPNGSTSAGWTAGNTKSARFNMTLNIA